MSDTTPAPQNGGSVSNAQQELASLLDSVRSAKEQVDEELKAIAQSRRKADDVSALAANAKTACEEQLKIITEAAKQAGSEGLLAFNAKKACEDHATAIAGIKGTVESEASVIQSQKQKSDELLAALTAGKAAIDSDQKSIAERRKEVDTSAKQIVTAAESGAGRLSSIESAFTAAESCLASIKLTVDSVNEANNAAASARKQAENRAAEADSARKQAENQAAEADALTKTVSDNLQAAKDSSEEIQTLLLQARKLESDLKLITDHLAKSGQLATEYERKLDDLTKSNQALNERIESLLPGATSVVSAI